MQLIDRSIPDRARDIDMMRQLVEAIARELWKLYGGGGGTVNWAGVERHLGFIVEQARYDARTSRSVLDTVAAAHSDAGPGTNEGTFRVETTAVHGHDDRACIL